eukprot:TRINITY_DN24621_c0_g1_i1.p1 TRINITY_DN24621_c0_g1~~TRINITY_DN24621_c0_g1_i1.p1  ORF type:complete len:522 (+),score=249.97 TRINITY_DN24621_c0_g1_i1:215-1567(+)
MDTGFSEATQRDMFRKLQQFGDKNEHGLSFNDVHRMVSVYPTLFNVLAFRIMDNTMNQRQVVIIERENAILGELAVTAGELDTAVGDLRHEADDKRKELEENAHRSRDLDQAVLKHRVELQGAHQDTLRAKAELNNALNLQAHSVEAENLKHQELGITPLKTDVAQAKREAEDKDRATEETAAEIERLEKQLDDLRNKLYDQRQEAFDAYAKVENAEAKLKDRLGETEALTRDIERADQLVDKAKKLLDEMEETEQGINNDLRKALSDLGSLQGGQVGQEAGLRDTQDYLRLREAEAEQAQKNLQAQRERVELLCDANIRFNTLRRDQYDKEEEVVNQEVRLREQRDCLEMKEAALRSEVKHIIPIPPPVNAPASPPTDVRPQPMYVAPVTPTSTPALGPYAMSGAYYPPAAPVPPTMLSYSPVKPTPLPGRDTRYIATSDHSGARAQAV